MESLIFDYKKSIRGLIFSDMIYRPDAGNMVKTGSRQRMAHRGRQSRRRRRHCPTIHPPTHPSVPQIIGVDARSLRAARDARPLPPKQKRSWRHSQGISSSRDKRPEVYQCHEKRSSHLNTPDSTPALLRNEEVSDTRSATASLISPELMFPVGRPDNPSPAPASTTLLATSLTRPREEKAAVNREGENEDG